MLRAWLRRLRKQFFGGKELPNLTRPQPRRVRLGMEPLKDRLAPAVLTVTSALDPAALTAETLRYAMNQANTDAGRGISDTIVFDTTRMGSNSIQAQQGQLELKAGTATTTIDGGGRVSISGGASGDFLIDSGAHVVLTGLTIASGRANLGGGVENLGTLTLTNATLTSNTATDGGAIYNSGTLTVSGTTLNRNTANDIGGAIDNVGTLTLTNSTLTGNQAAGNPMFYSHLEGGAIANFHVLTLSNCTFTSNTAGWGGGAIYNSNAAGSPGALTASNCTIWNNKARMGGGIYAGASATLQNTIVADNVMVSSSNGVGAPDIFGAVTPSSAHNLVGYYLGLSRITDGDANGNHVGSDSNPIDQVLAAHLAPLGSYGGPTQTVALLTGNPAIGSGTASAGSATDQRGLPRPANPDIGAYQTQPAAAFVVSAPTSTSTGTAFSVGITAVDAFGNRATSYSGPVTLASNDGQALPPTPILITNGLASVPTTLVSAGSVTLSAGAGSVKGTSAGITVSPAPFVFVRAPGVVTAGTTFSVTITARDPAGNPYSGPVKLTSSDGQAVSPATVMLSNGTATVSVTLATADTTTLTAAAAGLHSSATSVVVSNFYFVQNGVYYFVQNGDLYRYAPGLSAPWALGSQVASVSADGAGNIVFLARSDSSTGDLYVYNPKTISVTNVLPAHAVSFVIDGSGSAVALDDGNNLYRIAPGSTQVRKLNSTPVTAYALGDDGTVYYLQGGNLYNASTGARVPFSGSINAIKGRSDGQIYVEVNLAAQDLHLYNLDINLSPRDLYLYNPATGNGHDFGAVQSFSIGPDGNGYFLLPNQDLDRNTSSAQTDIASGVASFYYRSDGNLYVMHTNNDLSLDTPTGQRIGDLGIIQNFAPGPDGIGYLLQNGQLSRNTPAANIPIDGGVASVGFRSDGNLYVMHTNNDLTLDTPAGQQLGDFGIVQGFAIVQDGSGYVLQNGRLIRNTPSQNLTLAGNAQLLTSASDGTVYVQTSDKQLSAIGVSGTLAWVDANFSFWAPAPDGSAYVLGTDGKLWKERAGWQQTGRAEVEQYVSMFAPDGNNGLYILQFGQLFDGPVGATWQQTEALRIPGSVGNNHALDGNVVEIAPDGNGGLYVLFSGNDLYDITYVNGHRASWPGRLVTPDSVQDFYFAADGSLHWDQTPGFRQQVSNFFANLGKDLFAFELVFTGAGFIPVGGGSLGQKIFGNQFLNDALNGGIIVGATALDYFSAGALSDITGPIIAAAIGGAVGATFTEFADNLAFQTPYSWQGIVLGAAEGVACALAYQAAVAAVTALAGNYLYIRAAMLLNGVAEAEVAVPTPFGNLYLLFDSAGRVYLETFAGNIKLF
jgi:hypothetical protein